MYKRKLFQIVNKYSSRHEVILLTGPRQSGKTTLLKWVGQNSRNYVSLDDLEIRSLAKNNPKLFLERFLPPIIIDEFQYAPNLLPYVKLKVDEIRTSTHFSEPVSYWLTGSQNFSMMEEVQESMAGRVLILKLLGLDLSELQQQDDLLYRPPFFERPKENFEKKEKSSLADLFEIILKGDKPEVWFKKMGREETSLYYSSYIQTYLERDVRLQLGIKELGLFEKFMRLLASRVGQLLNMASLASEVGVKGPTIKSWLTILERSFQIVILKPYYQNLNKREVKTPKVYFLDTGLVTHLLKWIDPQQAACGPMAGSLFENWVVSEIIKTYWHAGQEAPLYFWRTQDGDEMDLVYEHGKILEMAEIKLNDSPSPGFFSPIEKVFEKIKKSHLTLGRCRVVTPSLKSFPLSEKGEAVSAWSL